jgi:hypothetical protein
LSMLFAKFFFLLLKGRFVIILCGEMRKVKDCVDAALRGSGSYAP